MALKLQKSIEDTKKMPWSFGCQNIVMFLTTVIKADQALFMDLNIFSIKINLMLNKVIYL